MNHEPLNRVTIALISDLLFDAHAVPGVMSVTGVCVWLLTVSVVTALCSDDTFLQQITDKLKDDDLIGKSRMVQR